MSTTELTYTTEHTTTHARTFTTERTTSTERMNSVRLAHQVQRTRPRKGYPRPRAGAGNPMTPGAWGPNPPESFTFSLSLPKITPKNPNDIEYLCNQLFFHYESL